MDAAQALSDLTEISSQIEAAVVLEQDGSLLASTLSDDAKANALADAARELLSAAVSATTERDGKELTQLEVATTEGSVFVVRDADRAIAAVTNPEPTVGLVFYDLKSCLRSVAAGDDDAGASARAAEQSEEQSEDPDAAP